MRILLTGCAGQLGRELQRVLPAGLAATDRSTLDLADLAQVRSVVREIKPEVLLNAAAYTAVDRAETEPATAMRVNGEAPGVLAEEAKRLGALLVHYSTDYVFDGGKRVPYVESDAANPLSAYAKSKLAGEQAVRATGCRHLILRSGWLYSEHGANFPFTILRKARELPRLRVVADQRGAPTWARDLAQMTASLLTAPPEGTYHAAAAGEATWHQYAVEVLRLASIATPVDPIATADYPAAARRPPYSVLDSGLLARTAGVPRIGDWRECLAAFMAVRAG